MKYQILFSRKNKKNTCITNLSSVELAQGAVKAYWSECVISRKAQNAETAFFCYVVLVVVFFQSHVPVWDFVQTRSGTTVHSTR